jgi:hypothetical protein
MKWISGDKEGRELLYVEGGNDNKVLVRGKILGITKTMKLDPEGFWLRKFSKHPIKYAGFAGIVSMSYKQFEEAKKNNDILAISCTMEDVDGRPAHKIGFAVSPQGKHNGYYCRSAVQYFDAEHFLPIKVTFWLWEDDEVEYFAFHNVKLNVGLNSNDFDKDNEEYKF